MAKRYVLSSKMAQDKIDQWTKIKNVMENAEAFQTTEIRPGFIDEIPELPSWIFKLYLQLGSVAEVAEMLNKAGVRKRGTKPEGKALISNDISDIIRNENISDINMMNLARSQLDNHSNFINKLYN